MSVGAKARAAWGFNPRLRVGGDLPVLRYRPLGCYVSIHASAWEATFSVNNWIGAASEFQSTPPRGRRLGVRNLFGGRVKQRGSREPDQGRHAA